MIICGFPGTGKSFMARHSNWIDLESTPFERDWIRYAKVAKHMSDVGYTVMTSTHAELLAIFEQMEQRYTVIIPPKGDANRYTVRYSKRGNTSRFITTIAEHWDEWIEQIIAQQSVNRTIVILPYDGCIEAWARETGVYDL